MKDRNKDLSYTEALHGMQAGVQLDVNDNHPSCTAKHLRVGVNSAMVDSAALARLLIAKGVITEAEYLEALRIGAIEELERYEDAVAARYGGNDITLR